jgi:hypothetical protein
MAARFKEYGLKGPGEGGSYFQMVPFTSTSFVPAESSLTVDGKEFKDGFLLTSARGEVDVTGKLIVLDVTGDRLDLSGASLEGAIVVVRGNSSFRTRAAVSRARAGALLFETEELPPLMPSISRGQGGRGGSLPVGQISKARVDELVAALSMSKLEFEGGQDRPAGSQMSEGTVKLVGKMESKEVGVPNVVALLEGSDPTLKAEVVGIGAHLDHLGVVNGVTYWGADDDGSGSAALLQVAEAFAKNPLKPRRSILFMAFCGEEMGLIGSGYYSDNPLIPNEQMIAELQMDMVGRNSDGVQNGDQSRVDKASENVDTIRLVGSKRISTELDALIMAQNKHVNFRFRYDAEDVYTRSDHYNFARKGIPIAFLFDGFHPDYHQPTDTVDKINWDKLTNSAKLFFLTAMRLANNEARPKKDVKSD